MYLHIPNNKRLAKFPMAKTLETTEHAILLAVFTCPKEPTILQITKACFLVPDLSYLYEVSSLGKYAFS